MKWNPGMRFQDGAFINNSLYFSHRLLNGCFRYDLERKKCLFLSEFPEEEILQGELHRQCIHVQNYLVFIPEMAKNIHVFNLNTSEIKCISIEEYRNNSQICFSDSFLWNDKIYIFPMYIDVPLLILNTKTWDLQAHTELNEILKKEIQIENKKIFARLVKKEEYVWAAICEKNMVIKFSLKNWNIKKYEPGIPNLFGIYAGADGFWLNGMLEKEIYLWNPQTEKLKKYLVDSPAGNYKRRYYNYIIDTGKAVYALAALDEAIYVLKDGAFCKAEFLNHVQFDNGENIKFFKGCLHAENLWVYPFSSDALIRIVSGESKAEVIKLPKLCETMSDEQYDLFCKQDKKNIYKKAPENILFESDRFTLKDYIMSLSLIDK